ncbi:PE domain-containing protein [Nocardia sp. NPDC005978]|uniref:PE domain-containing protein n=1 Tax=unclassified Nocardia TaxID=2637762 RepID=UPI0033B00DF0
MFVEALPSDFPMATAKFVGEQTQLLASLSGASGLLSPVPAAFDDVSIMASSVFAAHASLNIATTSEGLTQFAAGSAQLPGVGASYLATDISSGAVISAAQVTI